MNIKWAYFLMLIAPIGSAQGNIIRCEAESDSPSTIAGQTYIGTNYKEIIAWMRGDLENYLANFEAIFEAKLRRIQRHQEQREADFDGHTAHVRELLQQTPGDADLLAELERLTELHKAQGFIAEYADSDDFIAKYVGPKRKLLKSIPTEAEIQLMNRPGKKLLYVDTWAVPFFNTGIQTREQAKNGVLQALEVFRTIDLASEISILRFTELMALFARPEFDDVRRYKLLPFPLEADIKRFGLERSDAATFGSKYPEEDFIVLNKSVGLDVVSYIFGQRKSIFGLISHSLDDNSADGRIFTGPADFLEHDYLHAFANLTPAIPGQPEEWQLVHEKFRSMWDAEFDPKKKRMMMLVYYHLTHESGFRSLLPDASGTVNLAAFRNERKLIDELLHTRYHYDYILSGNQFPDGYGSYLDFAFRTVGEFFKESFLAIQAVERASQMIPPVVLTDIIPRVQRKIGYGVK